MRKLLLTLVVGLMMASTGESLAWDHTRAAHEQSFISNFALAAGAQIDTAGSILDSIERYNAAPRAQSRHRRARYNVERVRRVGSCTAAARIEVC